MNSSDSAEEIVKISLDGMEVALRIAGSGAKNIAVMIYTIMKDNQHQQTRGKVRLTNMLKSKDPLKIFTIKAEDLKKFSQEAKRYGVLYCVLADKKNEKIDGMVDIMVRETDASKVNRIAERFEFARVDTATIKRELEKEREERNAVEQAKSEDEKFIDDILSKPEKKQEQIKEQDISPSNVTKKTEEKSQLESFSNTKPLNKEIQKNEKKSVREELKIAEKEAKEKELQRDIAKENVVIPIKNKEGKHYKEEKDKKENYKGKRYKEPKHLDNTKKSKKKKFRERSK